MSYGDETPELLSTASVASAPITPTAIAAGAVRPHAALMTVTVMMGAT